MEASDVTAPTEAAEAAAWAEAEVITRLGPLPFLGNLIFNEGCSSSLVGLGLIPSSCLGTVITGPNIAGGGVKVTAVAACSASSLDKTFSETTVTRPALAAGGVLIMSLLE